MASFLIKRIFLGLVTIVLVSMTVYAFFWFGPKSPALQLCVLETNGRCGETSPRLAHYEERLGYDNPVHEEYGKWVKGLVIDRTIMLGNTPYECPAPCLGISFRDKSLVSDQLRERFPVTASIAVGAASLALLIGVAAGVTAARRRGSVIDKALVSSTLVLSALPFYLVALLSLLLLTFSTSIFPHASYVSLFDNPAGWFAGLSLVWLVMGLYGASSYARFSRGAMVEALNEGYIRTAMAKGVRDRAVTRHGLRAALVPVVTIFGLELGSLLAGAVFTEVIFDLEGIGKWGIDAALTNDLPVVQATSLIAAVAIIVMNIVVDVGYTVLDPRTRLS